MSFVICRPDMLGGQVSIDLRRRDIGMPKQLLDRSQIGAAIQHVRGEAMPEGVRRHIAIEPG